MGVLAVNDRAIPNGTFQGFTVFSDTVAHAAIWREVISRLHYLGVFGSELMSIIYMDDIVLSVDLNRNTASMSAEEIQRTEGKNGNRTSLPVWRAQGSTVRPDKF